MHATSRRLLSRHLSRIKKIAITKTPGPDEYGVNQVFYSNNNLYKGRHGAEVPLIGLVNLSVGQISLRIFKDKNSRCTLTMVE